MNVNTQGTDSNVERASIGRGSRSVADWMWPFLLGGVALFSISALFYYHFHRVELEPRSFLQVAFAGLYDTFGWAPTVVFFLLVFAWSLIWFVTGVLERPASRLVRLLVMAVMLGVFLNLGDGGVVQEPHKGAFGAWLAGRLVSAVGYLPSLAVVLVTTFASLLLATDWFFSEWFEPSRRSEAAAESGVEEAVTDHLRALADEPATVAAHQPEAVERPAKDAERDRGSSSSAVHAAAAPELVSPALAAGGLGSGAAVERGEAAEEGDVGAVEVEQILVDPDEQELDEIELAPEEPVQGASGAESRHQHGEDVEPAGEGDEEVGEFEAEVEFRGGRDVSEVGLQADEDAALDDTEEEDGCEGAEGEEEGYEDAEDEDEDEDYEDAEDEAEGYEDAEDEAEDCEDAEDEEEGYEDAEDEEEGYEDAEDEDEEEDAEDAAEADDDTQDEPAGEEGECEDAVVDAEDSDYEAAEEEEADYDASEEEGYVDAEGDLEIALEDGADEQGQPRRGQVEAKIPAAGGAGEEAGDEPVEVVMIPRPEAPPAVGAPTPPPQDERGRQQSLFGVTVDEDLVEEARELMASGRRPSASLLQRKLRIDYDLAQELLSVLVSRGLLAAEERR